MFGNSNRPKRILPHLLLALALTVSLPALGQNDADTRPYPAKNRAGLSLKLDLNLPKASRQHTILQPETQAYEGSVPGLSAAPAEQDSSSTWPYFLLGLVILGGTAAWYLRQQRTPPPLPASTVPPQPKPAREELSPNPFELDEKPKDEEADTAASTSPMEQNMASVQLLKSHIEQNPGESPVPWLLLLDLLHRLGDAKEYEQTRRQCKQHFNVDMPAYKKIKTASKRQGIESYPHIMNKLIRLWPGEEAASYLNALLHDSRDGSRVGFDLSTYHDIALLRAILETVSVSQDA